MRRTLLLLPLILGLWTFHPLRLKGSYRYRGYPARGITYPLTLTTLFPLCSLLFPDSPKNLLAVLAAIPLILPYSPLKNLAKDMAAYSTL